MKVSCTALSLFFSIASFAFASGVGEILLPHPGTHIAPGEAFNFSYEIRADYCVSSYAYSVYLITDMPTVLAPSDEFASGHFFGRFDAENYPAVPNPTHPAPPQLVMPDFSKGQGGFGAGQQAVDKTFQLAVFEEWDGCDPSGPVGKKISLAAVPIVYNATSITQRP